MTAPRLTPEEAIRIALTTAPPDMRGPSLDATLAVMALRLSGYQIVAAEGGAPPADAGASASVPQISGNARDAQQKPKPQPRRWPITCTRCHKIKNDQAHADECDVSGCPI